MELTSEEIEILKKLIINFPIQGNLQTLPGTLKKLMTILEKLEKAVPNEPDKN